jgi:hypothetical protein
MIAFGGGRSPEMRGAAAAYASFLFALAGGEADRKRLLGMLDDADVKLNVALEAAKKMEEGK